MQKKRILAILLAVVMVLGLCSMASATAPADRVQINNMMVDASLVEAKTSVEQQNTQINIQTAEAAEAATSTTTFNYPPIANISVGNNSSFIAADNGTKAVYVVHIPGGSVSESASFNFQLSSATSKLYSGSVTIKYDASTSVTIGKGGSDSLTMPLTTSNEVEFDVIWNSTVAGEGTTTHCKLKVDTSNSVSLYNNNGDYSSSVVVTNFTGATAEVSDLTVGGVTRYTCAIELPSGASNTSVNVRFRLESAGATATLGGTAARRVVDTDDNDNEILYAEFTGINFSSTKELVITNGSASRTYLVSAAAAGSTVTVYFALRTYLADEWINNRTTYYDYSSNGFGSGEDLSASDLAEVTTASSDLAAWNIPNAPESLDSVHNNRPIFAQNSYEEIEIDASASVMDVLKEFIRRHQSITTEITDSTTYISELVCNGNTLGEFSCGYGSGWMYTARTNRTDTISALPNAGASLWSISEGMYIDWYYTAAYGMDFGYSMFG